MFMLSTFTTRELGTVSVPTIIVGILYAWQKVRADFSPTHVSQYAHLFGGLCGFAYGLIGVGRSETQTLAAETAPLKSASRGRQKRANLSPLNETYANQVYDSASWGVDADRSTIR